MDIHIIQHSQTHEFHATSIDMVTDVLSIAVCALADHGIDATHYQSADDRLVEIPVAVRPLAQAKAATLRTHFETIATQFVDEGKPALADQVMDAMKDMPDDTMARLHDIFLRSVAAEGETATVQ